MQVTITQSEFRLKHWIKMLVLQVLLVLGQQPQALQLQVLLLLQQSPPLVLA
jgi:Ni,Fe-hydrogenase I cytochrome b subunit